MQLNTAVVINRPGHWSHLIQGEVLSTLPDSRFEVKIIHYFNNAQSFNPNIKLRPASQLPTAPMQAEIDVSGDYLLENNATNKDQIAKLTLEAED